MSHNAYAFLTNGHTAGMPWGGSLDWAMVLSILLCAFILICIAASLLFYRGREFETTALWLGSLGLLVGPLALFPISNFTVLRYSKQVTFCASCHDVMQPYVDDMHNRNIKTMAAKHYQDQFAKYTECYSCHATPGMYGIFRAKLTGLHEAFAYATGNYRLPLKLAKPFPNQFCLRCHDGARKFMAEDSHLDADGTVAKDLVNDTVRCDECHGPSHQVSRLAQTPPESR